MTHFVHQFSVAPMLNWTDRHCRYFFRLLSKHALLYTEMVTTGAILYGDAGRHLDFSAEEHPVALQLGGSSPSDLARCARIAQQYGYDEVNLNVGCPSDRVQSGRFGACLMAEPETVAQCIGAMKETVSIPVTVKTRIGIDDQDSYEHLAHFIQTVSQAGCQTFIIHARKAWLSGLSPKENREIPPLRYDVVEQVKRDFPDLNIILNGGLNSLEIAQQYLQKFDGVMLGREIYHNPYILADVDALFYGSTEKKPDRHEVLDKWLAYCQRQIEQGIHLKHLTRHILGLFQGQTGARAWRRHISEHIYLPNAECKIIVDATRKLLHNQ